MYYDNKILIAKSGDEDVYIYPKMANRHGMIAGATGTGKTVTLKVMAESFSSCGVPVFLADIKGDLAGMCMEGNMSEDIAGRVEAMGLADKGFKSCSYPVTFWDVYGKAGLPLRTTVTEMGPLLLARILELNDTQTDILQVIFKIADDEGLLLIDTKDLKSMITYVGENTKDYSMRYGNMSKQSLSAIIRAIVALEAQGGEEFFSEPAVNIADWFATDCNGKGQIQILDCQKLINNPTMYGTFMLWMLSELFETLPESGDGEKPKMVFFFDEAHLLFKNASKALLDKMEQVVKLIRSKGVGIYFITQSPKDIPDEILGQLGNKIQHALHAYTPAEMKATKAAAQAYRENPEFDTYEAITSMGIGEALISVLDEDGVPTIVKKSKILPPQSLLGTIDDDSRENEIKNNLLFVKYSENIDRDSAYEFFERKNIQAQELADHEAQLAEEAKAQAAAEKAEAKAKASRGQNSDTAVSKEMKSATKRVANSAAGTIGRELGKSVGASIGGNFGKRLGGNMGATLGRGILSTLFKL